MSQDEAKLRVSHWLAAQCSQSLIEEQTNHRLKRKYKNLSTNDIDTKQCDYTTLSSPPLTADTRSMLPSKPAKRQRRAQDITDEEDAGSSEGGDSANKQTPRPRTTNTNIIKTTSETSLDPTDSASSLNVSRTSSPSKQLQGMSLIEDGFVLDKLSISSSAIPADLMQLVEEMDQISQGFGILSTAAQHEVQNSGLRFASYVFAQNKEATTEASPSFMSPATAKMISERANQCELRLEDEASWNMEVHHHLLRRVCRPHGRTGLVDFVSCTTARIAPAYRPRNAPSKMVDFCLYINPTHDREISSAIKGRIDTLRCRLPHNTINHTDYAPLCGLPIGPSIETKPSAQDWKMATLQMGTWQSAQLRAISALQRSTAPASLSASSPSAITYFPSIIVQGHDWYFTATAIRDDGVKAFLSKITIGSTETPLGVYKISAALQCLVRWFRDVYWPLYKLKILKLAGHPS